jgi:hypothetical protein
VRKIVQLVFEREGLHAALHRIATGVRVRVRVMVRVIRPACSVVPYYDRGATVAVVREIRPDRALCPPPPPRAVWLPCMVQGLMV